MFKKILYIGAGLDFEPFLHFPETKNFLFIDSRPRNYYGHDYYSRGFYDKIFLPQLKGKLIRLNFNNISNKVLTDNYSEILVEDLDCTKSTWVKEDIILDYYYSTGIPEDLWNTDGLKEDISQCETLVVAGHHPHHEFVEVIQKPFHFIGYSGTYYPENLEEFIKEDENNKRNIITYIFQHPEVVKDYTFVNSNTGEKQLCKNYSEFYSAYKKN